MKKINFIKIVNIKFLTSIFLMLFLSFPLLYAAEDVEMKLNTEDASSKFVIKDSADNDIYSVDSNGNVISSGTVTMNGLIGAYYTIAHNTGGDIIPQNAVVVKITGGSSSGTETLTYSGAAVSGQFLFIYNSSGFDTTGIVTTSGNKYIFIYDGAQWVQW